MAERRYTEDEVSTIFANAALTPTSPSLGVPTSTGMTLKELQSIGLEVGLSADAVSRAAASLDEKPTVATRRYLGLPIAIAKTAELGREVSEQEWERFVGDLRDTFEARGHVESQGGFRHWWNGNL